MEQEYLTGLHNTSEIGRLRTVMLHRPGRELENLMPEYLERLLFDDIPYLKVAQEEHDAFAQCLRENGAQVLYLADLVAQTIEEKDVRAELIEQFLDESGLDKHRVREILKEYFSDMDNKTLVDTMMAGVRKSDIRSFETGKLSDYLSFRSDDYPFLIDPMPNLYFTRDPFATIGTGVSLHRMHTVTRNRETLFGKFIFQYHPNYKDAPKWYDRGETSSLEGGDILILSKEVIAVGISQRTHEDSIDKFAHTVLSLSK
ncbi:MAG: arginine deiminase, partial [Oscillospiraceae bacterium]|nr:arginine deiminase [Oscillospiraceae bacterium]